MNNFSLEQNETSNFASFDYSKLTEKERLSTLENEKKLDELYKKYQPEIGEILYKQQQILANHNEGVFQQWYESKGFKRWKVYDYINKYNYVLRNSEDPQKIDIFENMPNTLQSEISKPSTKPEVAEAILNGDVKTKKEIEELKRQLKTKDEQIATQARMIDDLTEQEPEVIEKEVVVERIPADYETVKATNERLEKQLSSVRNDLKMKKIQYDLLEQNTESAKALEANIKALQQKEKSIDQRVKATIEFNDLMREIETFFDTKMASLRFKPLINDLYDTEASNKLSEVVNSVDFWVSEMRKIIPNEKTKIIEGEIING